MISCKKHIPPVGQKELHYSPLERHSASPAGPKVSLRARLQAAEGEYLDLTFQVSGETGGVCFPAEKPCARADGLWRQTCFEAFLKPRNSEAYWEFNFSPSREWAVYSFSAYRSDMRAEQAIAPVAITINSTPTLFELNTRITVGPIAEFMPAGLRVGLTAVLKHTTGELSYWALRHPKAAPDFHATDGFVGTIF